MIAYVIAENPDDRILKQASQILRNGGLVCLPSDSNWVVLADPFEKVGVDKLYRLRHVDNTKHFTIFCADIKQASDIATINDVSFRFIKRYVPGPYTFIFPAQKMITRYLKASRIDHQVGVRICALPLMKALLAVHQGPAIGSHIDASMIADHPEDLSIWAGLIEDNFGHAIEVILDPGEVEFLGPTTVVDLSGDEGPVVIREGVGPL